MYIDFCLYAISWTCIDISLDLNIRHASHNTGSLYLKTVPNVCIQLVKRVAVKHEGSNYRADRQLASCRVYRGRDACVTVSRSYIIPTLSAPRRLYRLCLDRPNWRKRWRSWLLMRRLRAGGGVLVRILAGRHIYYSDCGCSRFHGAGVTTTWLALVACKIVIFGQLVHMYTALTVSGAVNQADSWLKAICCRKPEAVQ
jgi:hypothetical protein